MRVDALTAVFTLRYPNWVEEFLWNWDQPLKTDEQRMRLAVALSAKNVKSGGGPFGAATFDMATGELLSVGMNLVVLGNCSLLHAEVVAMVLAQQVARNFSLADAYPSGVELVSTTEPCAQCMGAIPWGGIRRLVCGAHGADAEAIGFDEGHKPSDWIDGYRQRGIEVVREVLYAEAKAVLDAYDGRVYNG